MSEAEYLKEVWQLAVELHETTTRSAESGMFCNMQGMRTLARRAEALRRAVARAIICFLAERTSGEGTSGEGTSGEGTSGKGTSGEGTSGKGTSGKGTSGKGKSFRCLASELFGEYADHFTSFAGGGGGEGTDGKTG